MKLSAMQAEKPTHNPYPYTAKPSVRARILVIDDEPAVLFAYRKLIEKDGITVDICENIEDALKQIRSQCYLAVIADMRLAGTDNGDGLEILRCVRHEQPDAITILATGYGDSEIEKTARAIGVTHYFKKPVPPADILRAINT